MGSRELARYRDIGRRLQTLRKKQKKIGLLWKAINEQRLEIQRQILMLEDERQTLEQGQMLFEDVG